MFTPGTLPRDFDRVRAAAARAVSCPGTDSAPGDLSPAVWPALARQARPACSIRQAVFARQERIPARDAAGRVCALPTVACPPAIPIAVSGEEIGPAAVELFRYYGIETVSVIPREN